jgi:hypothetical protein
MTLAKTKGDRFGTMASGITRAPHHRIGVGGGNAA